MPYQHSLLVLDERDDERARIALTFTEASWRVACAAPEPNGIVEDFDCALVDGGLRDELGLPLLRTLRARKTAVVALTDQGAPPDWTRGVDARFRRSDCGRATLVDVVSVAVKYARVRRELDEQRERLETFLQAAVHDLRAPARAIQFFAEELHDPNLTESDARILVESIRRAAEHAGALVRRLAHFARSGRLGPLEPVELDGLLAAVVDRLRPQLHETHGSVDVGQLPRVLGDPALLGEVFENLIANGLRYHREDRPRVVVAGALDGERPILQVSDNGTGIQPRNIAMAFTPFWRGDSRAGTGMGLAICKRIVEAHGGSISAESTPGSGTTFRLTLTAGVAAN